MEKNIRNDAKANKYVIVQGGVVSLYFSLWGTAVSAYFTLLELM